MGQMAKQIAQRPTNAFPSDTLPNPKEECKAIHLRSGKIVGEEVEDVNKQDKEKEKNDEKENKGNYDSQVSKKEKMTPEPQPYKKKEEVKSYVPKLSYPQRLHKEMRDK
ncbi:hypothetical protein AHAS_Ahas19G0148500 [Arachis hypogaea]